MSKGSVAAIGAVLSALTTVAVAYIDGRGAKPDQTRVVVSGQLRGLKAGFVVYVVGQEHVADVTGKFSFETTGPGPYSIVVQPAASDRASGHESYKLSLDGKPLDLDDPLSLDYTLKEAE